MRSCRHPIASETGREQVRDPSTAAGTRSGVDLVFPAQRAVGCGGLAIAAGCRLSLPRLAFELHSRADSPAWSWFVRSRFALVVIFTDDARWARLRPFASAEWDGAGGGLGAGMLGGAVRGGEGQGAAHA